MRLDLPPVEKIELELERLPRASQASLERCRHQDLEFVEECADHHLKLVELQCTEDDIDVFVLDRAGCRGTREIEDKRAA
jgi:hypothetical protein